MLILCVNSQGTSVCESFLKQDIGQLPVSSAMLWGADAHIITSRAYEFFCQVLAILHTQPQRGSSRLNSHGQN